MSSKFFQCPTCKCDIEKDVFFVHYQLCIPAADDVVSAVGKAHLKSFEKKTRISKPTTNVTSQSYTIQNDNVANPLKNSKRKPKKRKITVETQLRNPKTLPDRPTYTYSILGASTQTERHSNRKLRKRTKILTSSLSTNLHQSSKKLLSHGMDQHNYKNIIDRKAMMQSLLSSQSYNEKHSSALTTHQRNDTEESSSQIVFEQGVFDPRTNEEADGNELEQDFQNFDNNADDVSSAESEEQNGLADRDILIEMKSKAPRDNQLVYSPKEMFWLELAGILQGTNAPKYLYKTLQKWAMKLVEDPDFNMMQKLGYKQLIKRMAIKHNLENSRPYVQPLRLPSGHLLNVVRFNFMSQVYSLLSDDTLMKPENLVFGNNPTKKFQRKRFLGDIETSDFYIRSQELKCTDEDDVLVVIIFFIDKTYDKGNCFEPVSFTLGIFKRNIRQSPEAWRHLGFIPGLIDKLIPLHNHLRRNLANLRAKDYHYVLREILSDVINMTNMNDGVKWTFGKGDSAKTCNLKFVVSHVIGDIEGFDKLLLRKRSHQGKRMSHSCDIKRDNCMDPTASCTFHNFDRLNLMMNKTYDATGTFTEEERNEAFEYLDDMYFYPSVRNAFLGVDFGGNKNGLNSACGVCLMHTFKEKFPDLVVDLFLGLLGKSDDTVGKLKLETSMPRLITKVARQSARNFPKVSKFAFRLTKGKITYDANQKYARVFALYLYSLTTTCHDLYLEEHKKSLQDLNLCSSLLHDSLTLYEFLYQEKFPRELLQAETEGETKLACQPIQRYLEKYNQVDLLVMGEENRSIFPKVHYLTHIPKHILDLGSTKNFDGGPSEGNFQVMAKKPARKTQGRSELMDIQLCNNYADDNILRRALDKSGLKDYSSEAFSNNTDVHTSTADESEGGDDDSDNGLGDGCLDDIPLISDDEGSDDGCLDDIPLMSDGTGINSQSSKFSISWVQAGVLRVQPKRGNVGYIREFPMTSIQVVYNVLINTEPREILDDSIEGFTCLTRDGSIYRAHPSYRSGQEWYDYARIIWENGDVIQPDRAFTPGERRNARRRNVEEQNNSYFAIAKICMFIDLRQATFRRNSSFKPGLYALIHSVQMNNDNTGPTNQAVAEWRRKGMSKLVKFWTMEEDYHLIPVSQIHSPVFALQDYSDPDMLVKTEYVIEVNPFEDWQYILNRELGCLTKF